MKDEKNLTEDETVAGETAETDMTGESDGSEPAEDETVAEEMDRKRLADEGRMSGNGKSMPGYIRRLRKNNLIWLSVWVVIGVGIFVTGWLIWHTRANLLTVLAVLAVLPGAKRIVALIAVGRKHSVSGERCRRIETAVEPYIYAGHLDIHEYEPEETDEEPEPERKADTGEPDGETEPDGPAERTLPMERVIPWNVIFTDYIFTSTEKIMMADFLVVTDEKVLVLLSSIKQDPAYVKKYLTTGIRKWSDSIAIEFVRDDDELIRKIGNLHESKSGSGETAEAVSGDGVYVSGDPARLRERREVLAYLKSLAV